MIRGHMSHEKIIDAIEGAYGFRGSMSRLDGENENYLIELSDGNKFVIKLAPENYDRQRILMEHAVGEAIFESGLGVTLPRLIPDHNGNIAPALDIGLGSPRLSRLLHFVPGDAWGEKAPASDELLTALGKLVADLAQALSPLDLPAARITHNWDLAAAGTHRKDILLAAD